jgi:Fur family transcriptional regulator, ferric uptake regulator
MSTDVHATIAERLRVVGQRYTDGRRDLVERLLAAAQPLTIPELLEVPPRLPQSTAYRNLTVLEQAGVVHRIVANGDFARFELAEDLTEHHHHLICSRCGAVEDFTAPAGLERVLGKAVTEIEAAHGFTTARHRLDLVGLCAECGPIS